MAPRARKAGRRAAGGKGGDLHLLCLSDLRLSDLSAVDWGRVCVWGGSLHLETTQKTHKEQNVLSLARSCQLG